MLQRARVSARRTLKKLLIFRAFSFLSHRFFFPHRREYIDYVKSHKFLFATFNWNIIYIPDLSIFSNLQSFFNILFLNVKYFRN